MTAEQLKQIVPGISDKNLAIYAPLLDGAFIKYNINTKERVCCFIAQIAHESGSFNYTQEIASGKAYEGRRGLGNVCIGDGIKFKGRGLIQVTGRNNYGHLSDFLFGDLRLMQHPEIIEQPEYALKSACWYWQENNLNDICDKPDDWIKAWRGKPYNKFQWLTIKINGGLNGYSDRLKFYNKAKKILPE